MHLPARPVLGLMRVCRSWQTCIKSSPLIQDKPWIASQGGSVSSPTAMTTMWVGDLHERTDHFTRAWLNGIPIYSGSFQVNELFMASREQRYRHEIPGLFTMPARVTPLSEIRIPWNIMRQKERSFIELLFTRHRPSAGSREQPSWLHMLLTEPPVTILWIEVFLFKDWTSIAGHSQPDAYISRPVDVPVRAGLIDRGGVTFGMVRDAVDKIIDQPAYDRLTREGKPVTTRICFIADGGVVNFSEEHHKVSSTHCFQSLTLTDRLFQQEVAKMDHDRDEAARARQLAESQVKKGAVTRSGGYGL
jgi:hypothetical protein